MLQQRATANPDVIALQAIITFAFTHPLLAAGAPDYLVLIWYLPSVSENALPPSGQRVRSHYGMGAHLPRVRI